MDDSQQEDKCCYICGSADSPNLICSCSKCGDRQHLWCMRILLLELPDSWLCHECELQSGSISPTQVCDGVSLHRSSTMPTEKSPPQPNMKMKETKPGKVKFLPASEAAVLLPSDARSSSLPRQNSIKRHQYHEKNTPKTLRISSPVKPSAPVRDFCQLTEALRENRELKGKGKGKGKGKKNAVTVKPIIRQISSNTTGLSSSEKELKEREHDSVDKKKPKELAMLEKFINNPIKTDAIWRGQLEILNSADHKVYSGLLAFTPRWVQRKAYFFSLSLPSLLSFKLIPRNLVWDEMFEDSPPDEYDVTLYLLPEFSDRCGQPYQHLIDMLDSSDNAMHAYINGVELIVFTSKWLEMACQKSEGQHFLWGSYRVCEFIAHKGSNIALHPTVHEKRVEESNADRTVYGEVKVDSYMDMEVDMVATGEVEVDMDLDMTHKECTAPTELIVSKEKKPNIIEQTRKTIKEENLECPPGFESPYWWKKRKIDS